MNSTPWILLCGLSLPMAAPAPGAPMSGSGTWEEQAKLRGSDTDRGDFFGSSVALSGSMLLVGAHGHGDFGGAVYEFVDTPAGWIQGAKLTASDGQSGDWFGISVSTSGDDAVVGAPCGGSAPPGYAYVFTRSGTTWSQQAKIIPTDPGPLEFGYSVSIHGDRILIGCPVGGAGVGRACVFRRRGTTWHQEARLEPAGAPHAAEFGYSVSLGEDTAMIGAWHEGLPGMSLAGAAYVFVRSGTTWTQEARLTPPDPGAYEMFGRSVSLSGDTALIGKTRWYGGSVKGAAYAYVRSGASWQLEEKLVGGDTLPGDRFGHAVSLLGDRALVGASDDDDVGSAYVFERTGTQWTQQAKLVGSGTGLESWFGRAVALSEGGAAIGAARCSSGYDWQNAYVFAPVEVPGQPFCFGRTADGNPCPCNNDNDGSQPQGGCRHDASPAGARLDADGVASVSADTLVLRGSRGPISNATLFFQGTLDLDGAGAFLGDGVLCTGGLARLVVRMTDASGAADSSPLVISTLSSAAGHVIQPGETLHYQWWIRDPNGSPCSQESNTSNGYSITWIP